MSEEKKDNINKNNVTDNNTQINKNDVIDNNKKNNTKKKKHRFLKFLLFLVIIIILFKVVSLLIGLYKQRKYDDFVKNNVLVLPNEEIKLTEEELMNDSNSDGIINKEKIRLGLDILSDDTDGDGVTDYDEINIYHSDPKKYSTSGDIYSDGYKIKNNYDIKKYYHDKATMNVCDGKISLTIDDAKDTEAYYKEYKGNIPSGYNVMMQPFRIYSFKGKAEIKIENPKYYDVLSYDNINKKVTKLKTQSDDKVIRFDVTNDNPLLIVLKNKYLKNMETNINSNVRIENNIDSEYILLATPIINRLLNIPVYVYQVDNSKIINTKNTELANRLTSKANGKYTVEVTYINSIIERVIDSFFGGLENQLVENGIDRKENPFVDEIFIYKHLYGSSYLEDYMLNDEKKDESVGESESTEYAFEEKYNNKKGEFYADSGFSVIKNAFNFCNLSTLVSNGGVCMGFAHITTSIYNDANLPKTVKSEYDLSSSAYDTIWNKNLYYYKATSELSTYADDIFDNEPTLNSSSLGEPDAEVVKALEYNYVKMNNNLRMNKFGWAWNQAGDKQTHIKASTIKNLVSKFKSGKIVSTILLGNGQHAINTYKIVEDKNDEDILYIKAYDNNFPGDMFWNSKSKTKQKYDVTITLKRCYKKNFLGQATEYYLFDYNPINNNNYHYGNINGGTDGILFVDENGRNL